MNEYLRDAIPILGCLLLSFLLSGLESAILSISRVRLRHSAKQGVRGAAAVDHLVCSRREELLISIQLVNATVNLVAFALITNVTVNWLGNWGYLAAFAVSLPVYLVWVELLPKSVFKRFPIRSLIFFSPVLWMIHFTVRPLMTLMAIPVGWLLEVVFGERPAPPGATREEFRALTEVFEREGTLDPAETRMIRNVLDFHKVEVGEVMLPLSRVTAVPREMPVESILALARQTDFDQFSGDRREW